MVGGSHSQGLEVHDMFFICLVYASVENNKAAMWEHASPKPAIHVQWAEIMVPPFSAATHGFNGVPVTAWECLTVAVRITLDLSGVNVCTDKSPTHPATKYL